MGSMIVILVMSTSAPGERYEVQNLTEPRRPVECFNCGTCGKSCTCFGSGYYCPSGECKPSVGGYTVTNECENTRKLPLGGESNVNRGGGTGRVPLAAPLDDPSHYCPFCLNEGRLVKQNMVYQQYGGYHTHRCPLGHVWSHPDQGIVGSFQLSPFSSPGCVGGNCPVESSGWYLGKNLPRLRR